MAGKRKAVDSRANSGSVACRARIATGLHDTWMRKAARGTVAARLTVGDQTTALPLTTDDSGWTRTRVDTSARAGQTLPVRLEITSDNPYDRFFAFAAEARQ